MKINMMGSYAFWGRKTHFGVGTIKKNVGPMTGFKSIQCPSNIGSLKLAKLSHYAFWGEVSERTVWMERKQETLVS